MPESSSSGDKNGGLLWIFGPKGQGMEYLVGSGVGKFRLALSSEFPQTLPLAPKGRDANDLTRAEPPATHTMLPGPLLS